jgi:uncharacterized repeat protein (TIGR01451 family)
MTKLLNQRKGNILFLLFLFFFTPSVLTAQSSLCTPAPPAPHALCTPPLTFDVSVVATGTNDWQTLTGVSPDNVTQKIKITGSGTVIVPNTDLLLKSANAVIYLDGPTLIVNNGNLQLTTTGSRFIMNGGKLQTFGNFQQTIETVVCITGTKVEVGEEEADGLFNTTGNTKSAANWQNDGGYRYLNSVCVNVTQDYQLQSTGNGQGINGLDVIIDCCFEIGDRGLNHATPTAFQEKDPDDTGNWQNSRIQKIYGTDIVIANGNFQNSNDTMLVCNVDVKINVTGSFQVNSGYLLGDGLCIAAEDIIENSAVWSANVRSWYSFKQNSIGQNQPITGTIPAESTQSAILAACFTQCCVAQPTCSAPTLSSVAATSATCLGQTATANSDAMLVVRGISGMAKYAYRNNATDSLFAITATTSTADSIKITGLANPSVATTYTFRLWAADTTCYNDTTILLKPAFCGTVMIDSVVNFECDPYQSKWLAKVYFNYTTNRADTLILNGNKFPMQSGSHSDALFCGLFSLNSGIIVFDLKFASDTTVKDTAHFASPVGCTEIDPIGFFYCSQTGRIVPGCDIAVTGPGNVTFVAEGCLGRYQWLVDAPGLYTMTYTLPPGYSASTTCQPTATVYDPPTNMGDTVFLGNDQDPNNPRFLTSNACTPHYLQFQLDVNDPIIAANNIALNCNCNTTTTVLSSGQTATINAESGISNIVWQRDTGTGFFNLPVDDDDDNNENVLIVSEKGTYRYLGTLANGCPYESVCEHRYLVNKVDLTLTKTVNTPTTTKGSNVIFTIKVKNQGGGNATGVTVHDTLPVGMTFVSAMPNGVYDPNTKLWTIGNLNGDDSATLTMTVRIDSVGVTHNTAEVHAMNEADEDSTPNNKNTSEDDIARVGVSVPVPLCTSQGQTLSLSIPSGFSNIKWYKNNVLIGGQTSNSLIVNQIGNYTFTADEATCPVAGCAAVQIVEGDCAVVCKPMICLPVTVVRQ